VRGRALACALLVLAACTDRAPRPADRLDRAFRVADSLRLEGRYAQAAPILRALRDSFALAHDSAGLWRADLWWSDVLLGERRIDSARAVLDEAMLLAGANASREGWVRSERSLLFDRLGKFDSAEAAAMRARALARATNDRKLEANSYNEMGRIHSLSGHYREALDDNTRALAIEQALGGDSSRGVAIELNELGIGYRHLGRFTDAEQAFGRAIVLERARGNPEGIARATFNLANVYVATGDDARALPLMLEALRLVEPTGNVRGEIFLHTDLGALYTRVARWQPARAHIDSALALNHGTFAYSRVELLGALGRLELAQGRAGMALLLLDSARRSADSGGYGRERASSRASLARAAIAAGDARAAVRWARAAVLIADSLGDPEAQSEAYESNAAAMEAAGLRGALGEYMRTIALLESWRGRLALGDLRMGVAPPRIGAYEGAIRLLVRGGHPGEAFEIAERARARLLLDLMRDHDAGPARSGREEMRRRIRERYDARDDVSPRERDRIDREVAALIDSLGSASPDAATEPRDPAPQSLSTIRSRVVTRGRAMFAVFWGERDVYGWWITPSAARGVRLGRADSLSMVLEFLRGAINDGSGRVSWQAPARRAYASFVAPLAPDPAAEVVVIADGALAYVPVEVFLPPDDSLPWGATRRFVYGPSASVLALLAATPMPVHWEGDMLAVGDPSAPAARNAADPHGERLDARAPLPFAAGEARDVAALFPAARARVLVGGDATLTRWLALDPGHYRYLHFAAHAALSGGRPGSQAVVLADSALDLRAIRRLDLTAELVTLSACETALGFEVRGEGILGLSHAFLTAGARGTVVTLWPIRDRSAAEFMTAFYGELNAGVAPAAALLAVRRRWIMSGGVRSHPFYWAPYVMVGGR
jgi:tetratricopeptide (TPR) repeat protein